MSRNDRNAGKREAALEALRKGLSTEAAARAAGTNRTTLWRWRQADEEFSSQFDDAIETGTDKLEDSALERALEGDTTLTIFLLKARRPGKYRERIGVEHSGQIARPDAEALSSARAAGADPELEEAMAHVASLDAARARKRQEAG